VVLAGVLLWLSGCVAPRAEGKQCLFNDDCANPLVCAANVCRSQCRTDRDCPTPQVCAPSEQPSKRVCLLAAEPAVCGSDRDCPVGSVCAGRGCWWTCSADESCARRAAGACSLPERLCSIPVTARAQLDEPRNISDPPVTSPDASMDGAALDASAMDSSMMDSASDGSALDDAPRERPTVDGALCPGPGAAVCAGRCADLAADPLNCGACGATCLGACADGRCVTAAAVSVGGAHTCVRGSDGTVFTAGQASALGLSVTADRRSLTRVPGITGATLVRCTHTGGCALRAGLPPLCWGLNDHHQFSVGASTTPVLLPTEFLFRTPAGQPSAINPLDVRAFAAAYTGACAATGTEVFCWGRQALWSRRPFAAAGGALSADAFPIALGGARQLVSFDHSAAELSTACALRTDGRIACWGPGFEPYASSVEGTPPPPIATLDGFAALDSIADGLLGAGSVAGLVATCGIDRAGVVWCGSSAATSSATQPPIGPGGEACPVGATQVPLLAAGPALGVAVSDEAACAIQSDRTVVCWGRHSAATATLGRRGLTEGARYGAQLVERCELDGTMCRTLSGITQISGGPTHLCAVSTAGEVYCWGANGDGQLASGDIIPRPFAVRARW
jgi:hypothetical protein